VILRSALLARFDWLEHGFGTRHAPVTQDQMASLKQIHSAIVLDASLPRCVGEGDALVTAQSSLAVSVRTADCYPILLADSRTRIVAAVHAGWRGTTAGIVRTAIAAMAAMGSVTEDIHAAIGPGIGVCCYEVGEDVACLFGLDGRGNIDLAAANRALLMETGVPEANIDVLGGCTRCDAGRFHSFRRDQQRAGRMISYIRAV